MATQPAPIVNHPVARSVGQAGRGAATRAKLISATIATLNALGYTATTTIEVVRRAQVSRGAMLHHFSTRAELLLATHISQLLVFKLGGTAKLPDAPAMAKRVLDPPPFTGTPDQIAHGGDLHGGDCSVCHGDAAVAGGLVPDLRHSPAIDFPYTIKSVAIDGALAHNGMVSFASALRAADAEEIRHILLKRANEDKALEGGTQSSK